MAQPHAAPQNPPAAEELGLTRFRSAAKKPAGSADSAGDARDPWGKTKQG